MNTISRKDPVGRSTHRKHTVALMVLCPVLSAAATLPFFFIGKPLGGKRWWWNEQSVRTEPAGPLKMPDTHDMYLHWWQMRSFYRGLQAGEIYPRWEEATNRGFGAPTTIYYPPGIYYVTSAMFLLVRDWGRALMGSCLLIMIVSGAAFYFYARRFLSGPAALIAMSAYILLPYHLIDQYERGALAELLGFVWMPLTLLFADRVLACDAVGDDRFASEVGHSGGRRPRQVIEKIPDIAGLAVCYGAFIWSHLPTAYQFTFAFGLPLVLLALVRRNYRGIVMMCAGAAIGLGLSGAYLYPAIAERDLIHYDRIKDLYTSFVFSLEDQGLGSLDHFNNLLDGAWVIGVAAMLLCGLVLLRVGDTPRQRRQIAVFWLAAGSFAAFMMTRLSIPLGKLIPKLETGIYSWRLLSIVTLVAALCAGVCAEAALDGIRGVRRAPGSRLAAAGAALILAIGTTFSVTQVMIPMAAFETFEPSSERLSDITMPRTIQYAATNLPVVSEMAGLLGQKGAISIRRWDPERRELGLEMSESDRLVIRTFDFPGWTAQIDDRQVNIEHFGPTAAITFEVPAGNHLVRLDFLDTGPRKFGKAIGLFSSLLLLIAVSATYATSLYRGTSRGQARLTPGVTESKIQ